MYDSRDMEHDRHNFFWFWTIFCLFTPLTPKKIKTTKKKKKKKPEKMPGDIITSYKCTKNHDHMLYCSWDMVCDRYNCFFFILGYFLPFHPHNSPKNENLKKNGKTLWRYHHITQLSQKSWSYAILFLIYGTWQM